MDEGSYRPGRIVHYFFRLFGCPSPWTRRRIDLTPCGLIGDGRFVEVHPRLEGISPCGSLGTVWESSTNEGLLFPRQELK